MSVQLSFTRFAGKKLRGGRFKTPILPRTASVVSASVSPNHLFESLTIASAVRAWPSPQGSPRENVLRGSAFASHPRRRRTMSSAILEARGLEKSYDDGRIEALRGVDLSIDAGEYVAISGPSGSGKSTLLQLLGGLDTPTQRRGSVRGSALGNGDRSRYLPFAPSRVHLPGLSSCCPRCAPSKTCRWPCWP